MQELHFLDSGTVQSVSDSSADDVGRLDQIFKDSIVDSGQSSAVWSLLALVGLHPLGLNGSLCNEQEVGFQSGFEFRNELFVELLNDFQAWIWNVDEVDWFALFLVLGGVINFSNVGNVDVLKVVFPIAGAAFKFVEFLGDVLFKLSWFFLGKG